MAASPQSFSFACLPRCPRDYKRILNPLQGCTSSPSPPCPQPLFATTEFILNPLRRVPPRAARTNVTEPGAGPCADRHPKKNGTYHHPVLQIRNLPMIPKLASTRAIIPSADSQACMPPTLHCSIRVPCLSEVRAKLSICGNEEKPITLLSDPLSILTVLTGGDHHHTPSNMLTVSSTGRVLSHTWPYLPQPSHQLSSLPVKKPCGCPWDWKEADSEILQNRMHSKMFRQEKLAEREIKVSLQPPPVALGPSCERRTYHRFHRSQCWLH